MQRLLLSIIRWHSWFGSSHFDWWLLLWAWTCKVGVSSYSIRWGRFLLTCEVSPDGASKSLKLAWSIACPSWYFMLLLLSWLGLLLVQVDISLNSPVNCTVGQIQHWPHFCSQVEMAFILSVWVVSSSVQNMQQNASWSCCVVFCLFSMRVLRSLQ